MSSPLKTFTGFKGKVAFAQIGSLKFAIVASKSRDLEILWAHFMPGAEPIDPAGIKSAILIEASTLPDARKPISLTPGFSQVHPSPPTPKTVSTVSPPIEV